MLAPRYALVLCFWYDIYLFLLSGQIFLIQIYDESCSYLTTLFHQENKKGCTNQKDQKYEENESSCQGYLENWNVGGEGSERQKQEVQDPICQVFVWLEFQRLALFWAPVYFCPVDQPNLCLPENMVCLQRLLLLVSLHQLKDDLWWCLVLSWV